MSEAELLNSLVAALHEKTVNGAIKWERSDNRSKDFSYSLKAADTRFTLGINHQDKLTLRIWYNIGAYVEELEEPHDKLANIYELALQRAQEESEKQLSSILQHINRLK
jgi:hypothetical protein